MGQRSGLSLALMALFACVACGGPQRLPGEPGSANPGLAVGTAVAAGVVWAAGGGCRLQGCPYGSYCDEKSGFCEVRKCSEGCPTMTVCNEGLDRCQAPAPATGPSDRLPQDDKINYPPGSH
jgi:hypothetical protein